MLAGCLLTLRQLGRFRSQVTESAAHATSTCSPERLVPEGPSGWRRREGHGPRLSTLLPSPAPAPACWERGPSLRTAAGPPVTPAVAHLPAHVCEKRAGWEAAAASPRGVSAGTGSPGVVAREWGDREPQPPAARSARGAVLNDSKPRAGHEGH